MPIFILQLCVYLIAGNAKCSGVTTPPRPPICVWNKPNLVANALLCSDFSQYVIFFPSLFNARFFTSGIGSDNLLNVFKDWIIFFIWTAWVLFNFYLKKKTDFQFGVWLRIHLHFLPSRNLGIHRICSTPSII